MRTSILFALVSVAGLTACAETSRGTTENSAVRQLPPPTSASIVASAPTAAPSAPTAAPNQPPTGDARKGESLTGVVIKKSVGAKDAEGWQATGGDDVGSGAIEGYLVLDTGSETPKHKSAREGVILRGGDGATYSGLAAAVGMRVRVYGAYVFGKPYVPKDPSEQYPMGPDGKPLSRGAGFRVVAFDRM